MDTLLAKGNIPKPEPAPSDRRDDYERDRYGDRDRGGGDRGYRGSSRGYKGGSGGYRGRGGPRGGYRH